MCIRSCISVVLCTRNRGASLHSTLQSLAQAVVLGDLDVELIVVNNGSTDSTAEVVRGFTISGMAARYVSEPKIGKGYAYNAGVTAAQGEVLLFTDDDVRVPSDWVERMCRPILNGEAEAVQGGVRLAPHLERPWLTGCLRLWLAAVEHPNIRPEGLVGANMAIRRETLAATGGFDPRLGPGAAGFFDDTMVGWAIERAGGRILYLPGVAVEHHFDPDRLALRSFFQIARRMAASRALVMKDAVPSTGRPSFFELFCELPGLVLRFFTQAFRLIGDPRPDPGFLVRYYRICLWAAMRRK